MGNVGRRASAARIEAPGRSRRMPPIEAGYQHFRLERQGALLAPNTLLYYDRMVLPFLVWLDGQGVRRFEELDAGAVRTYRAGLAARPGMHGRPLAPKTLLESHRAILCFLRWARRERSWWSGSWSARASGAPSSADSPPSAPMACRT